MRCEKREQKGQGAMAYTMKEIIVMVSVLIICILLIRRIFRREIGRRFQYALWFLKSSADFPKISICALVFGGIKTYDSRVYTCASVG